MAHLDVSARGIFVIMATPFLDDGSLDRDGIDQLVDFYLEREVDGLTVLGMMGEASKLSTEESLYIVERAVKRAKGVPIIVGVTAPGLAPMAELAKPSMELGASGVMIAPPSTLQTDDEIVGYYANAAQAVGPDTPFVIQDYPYSTGVRFAPKVITRIVQDSPTCVMLKNEDWPSLAKFTALREASDRGDARRISILGGNGGLNFPDELMRGSDGAMTGFSYPDMLVEVYRAHAAGDIERAYDIFDLYLPIVRYELQPGLGMAIRKYILKKRGALRCDHVRSPGPKLSNDDIADIERLIERMERKRESFHTSS
jgi:4-hydroxy-tetrahydrodipicolinate synthase